MVRTLPFDATKEINDLLIILHSDHHIYGGTPSVLNPHGGLDTHWQLQFHVREALAEMPMDEH